MARLNERFGSNYVIDLLRGSRSEKLREEHKQLKTYGVGADTSKTDWHDYLRQLVGQGYLAVTDDAYPVLKLTGKSSAVLKGSQKVELIVRQNTEESQQEAIAYQAELLSELKLIRRDIALKDNVPAYIILSDAALMEMATYLPQTPAELALISGFGEAKLARFGETFLTRVQHYCAGHGLLSRKKQKSSGRVRAKKGNQNNAKDQRHKTGNIGIVSLRQKCW